MTEEDDIFGDEEIEGPDSEEYGWSSNDNFFSEYFNGWEDSQGNYHDILTSEPDDLDAELRVSFDTEQEAVDYINQILTGADQFFDIFYDADAEQYEVYYMGGSE